MILSKHFCANDIITDSSSHGDREIVYALNVKSGRKIVILNDLSTVFDIQFAISKSKVLLATTTSVSLYIHEIVANAGTVNCSLLLGIVDQTDIIYEHYRILWCPNSLNSQQNNEYINPDGDFIIWTRGTYFLICDIVKTVRVFGVSI